MQPTSLFAHLRGSLRGALNASGADFGLIEVRHGLMQQETTVILYTDRTSPHFRFVPEVMDGAEGPIDFRVGHDQIWIHTSRPVRFQVKPLTSRQRDPLRVKVDVYERQGRYELNILVPLAMQIARLGIVVDTASLFRSEEPELPAVSMVGPIFEGLKATSSPRHAAETLAHALAQELRATLGPDYQVTLGEPEQAGTSGGIASLIKRMFGRKGQEREPMPGVREEDHGYTIHAASAEDAMRKLHELQATLEPGEMLIPRDPLSAALQAAVGAQHPSSDGSSQADALLVRSLRTMSPELLRTLHEEDCDTCDRRGTCHVEPLMRKAQHLLGITPKSRRHGVAVDPWSSLSAIGSMFGSPSFPARSRRDGHDRRSDQCASCKDVSCSSHPDNPARKRREAEAQASSRQADRVAAGNPAESQAPQSGDPAAQAAASSDAGDESAQDQAEAVETGAGEAQAEAPSSGNGSAS